MNWWKILGVGLILYGLTVGMLVPLKPGIKSALPSSANSGQIHEMYVAGYNTHYSPNDSHGAWLKVGEFFLKADEFVVVSPVSAKLVFDIPSSLPFDDNVVDATLIIHNEKDKTSVLPNALFIKQSTSDSTGVVQSSTWSKEKPKGLGPLKGLYFPYRNILVESIRNIYYHVSLWFAMFVLLFISIIQAIRYLMTRDDKFDKWTNSLVSVGVLYGILGLATGAIWAKFTWGTFWTNDVKLNMAAVSMLLYLGYFLLRSSFSDREQRAVISSAYAIFAYAAMIPLLFIVPRLTDSLHPGNGGNPGLGGEDLDHTMRLVFYPTIVGFILFGYWIAQVKYRYEKLKDELLIQKEIIHYE